MIRQSYLILIFILVLFCPSPALGDTALISLPSIQTALINFWHKWDHSIPPTVPRILQFGSKVNIKLEHEVINYRDHTHTIRIRGHLLHHSKKEIVISEEVYFMPSSFDGSRQPDYYFSEENQEWSTLEDSGFYIKGKNGHYIEKDVSEGWFRIDLVPLEDLLQDGQEYLTIPHVGIDDMARLINRKLSDKSVVRSDRSTRVLTFTQDDYDSIPCGDALRNVKVVVPEESAEKALIVFNKIYVYGYSGKRITPNDLLFINQGSARIHSYHNHLTFDINKLKITSDCYKEICWKDLPKNTMFIRGEEGDESVFRKVFQRDGKTATAQHTIPQGNRLIRRPRRSPKPPQILISKKVFNKDARLFARTRRPQDGFKTKQAAQFQYPGDSQIVHLTFSTDGMKKGLVIHGKVSVTGKETVTTRDYRVNVNSLVMPDEQGFLAIISDDKVKVKRQNKEPDIRYLEYDIYIRYLTVIEKAVTQMICSRTGPKQEHSSHQSNNNKPPQAQGVIVINSLQEHLVSYDCREQYKLIAHDTTVLIGELSQDQQYVGKDIWYVRSAYVDVKSKKLSGIQHMNVIGIREMRELKYVPDKRATKIGITLSALQDDANKIQERLRKRFTPNEKAASEYIVIGDNEDFTASATDAGSDRTLLKLSGSLQLQGYGIPPLTDNEIRFMNDQFTFGNLHSGAFKISRGLENYHLSFDISRLPHPRSLKAGFYYMPFSAFSDLIKTTTSKHQQESCGQGQIRHEFQLRLGSGTYVPAVLFCQDLFLYMEGPFDLFKLAEVQYESYAVVDKTDQSNFIIYDIKHDTFVSEGTYLKDVHVIKFDPPHGK